MRWLVCHVDAVTDGQALLAAAMEQMRRWGVTAVGADCALPAPGCYGFPDTLPHLRALLTEAGYGQSEPSAECADRSDDGGAAKIRAEKVVA